MKRKITGVLTALILVVSMLLPAFAAEDFDTDFLNMVSQNENTPIVYLTDIKSAVGEDSVVKLYMGNVKGLTSADFVIQYNPYMLQFEGFEASALVSNSQIYVMATENTGPNQKDDKGNIAHEVRIAIFHVESFPSSIGICEIGSIKFKAIGGGECPLELTASSFIFDEDNEVEPKIQHGTAVIEGEEASSWDYSAIATDFVTVPTDDYKVDTNKHLSKGAKAAIAVIAVLIVVLIIVFIAKGNTVEDDEDVEDDKDLTEPGAEPTETPEKKESEKDNSSSDTEE